MHGRTKAVLPLAALVLLTAIFLQGSIPSVVSGTWGSAGSMSAPRGGASAALLPDGRILIAGGQSDSGPMASAEFFGSNGSFSLAPPMHMARSGHSATLLADGRLLVAGGVTLGEGPTNAVEIYDPASDSWSFAGSLLEARAGHTATRLEDGRVLIAGGGRATLEIYDPERDSFSYAGSLSAPRSGHAAATLARWPAQNNRLIDRQVIFVGGSDGSNVLSSTEIYDPATGQVSAGPALPGPRQNASAVTVLGGYVYVAGGSDGSQDLSSALLISRDGEVSAAADLLSPRSGHIAVRLPGNNSVLIAGGSGGSSAEIYIPWLNEQVATGSMSAPHSGGASASAGRGLYLAAGGSGSSSAELYGYATIDTDKNDYAPGEIVTITGSGWAPGETVTLVLREDLAEPFHGDRELTAVADAYGSIFDASFAPEEHDLGVRFFLTATGAHSQARTTFTDAINFSLSVSVLGAQTPNPVEAGSSATYGTTAANSVAVTFTAGGSGGSVNACTAGLSVSAGLPSGATASFSSSSLTTSGPSTQTLNSLLTINTTSTTPAGTYTITVKAAKVTNCTGNDATTTVPLVVVAPKLVFTSAPLSIIAGQCSAVTVQRQDSGGTPTTTGNQVVNLSTNSAGGAFYSSSLCTTTVSSTTITNGNSESSVFYKDNVDGNPTLTASATGFTSGTQIETINLQLAFTSAPFTVNTGVCSPLITLESRNFAGTKTAPSANRTLSLLSSSGGGTFYSNAGCTTSITQTILNQGGAPAGTASFYYKDTTVGTPLITVSGLLLVSAAQTETINAPDSTAPVVTVSFEAVDGLNGWYVHSPVTGSVTATDSSNVSAINCTDSAAGLTQGSLVGGGTTSASRTLSVTGEGTHNISCTATDSASNTGASAGSTTMPVVVKIDTVAPTLTLLFTPDTPDGDNGWWKTPGGVPFAWTCSDGTSGIDNTFNSGCPSPMSGTVTAQGTTNFTDQVRDQAGNLSAAVNRDLKLDNVAPTLTLAFTPDSPDGSNGWWKTPGGVPFAWTCSDATSGIDPSFGSGCPSPLAGTVTAQGTTNFTDQVRDLAGNLSVAVNRDLKLDNVAPTLTLGFTPDSPDGSNGWWKTPGGVPFEWTCSDATSGIDPSFAGGCPSSLSGTVTAQGTTNFSDQVRDLAGNLSVAVNRDLMLDNVAPTLTLGFTPDSPDGNNGWWKTPGGVPFLWTCSDATSGIDPSFAGGCPSPLSGTVTAQGTTNFSDQVRDLAGNLSVAVNRDLMLDNVAPTISVTGFNNGDVFYTGSPLPTVGCSVPTDPAPGSGIQSTTGPTNTADTRNVNGVGSVTYQCTATDYAGNTGYDTRSFSVQYGGVSGILQPINPDNTSVFKRGQAVPVKFRLAGDEFTGFQTSGWQIQGYQVACTDQSPIANEPVESVTPSTFFRYDPTADQYIYNADFRGVQVGSCWRVKVTLDDSATVMYSAYFKVGK